MPHFLVGAWLFVGTIACCFGQATGLRIQFERQNNVSYFSRLELGQRLSQGKYRQELSLRHTHIINTGRAQAFVQFLARTNLWQYWQITPHWEAVSWFESDYFGFSEAQRHSLYLGASWMLLPELQLMAMLGYTWDFRNSRWDPGWTPAGRVHWRQRWEEGFSVTASAFARTKYIAPRLQRNITANIFVGYQPNSRSQLGAQLKLGSHEIDDYRLGSVERILSDTFAPSVQLRYQFAPGWFWDGESGYMATRRQFVYDPIDPEAEPDFNNFSFDQTQLTTRQRISFGNARWELAGTYTYTYIGRRYALENQLGLAPVVFQRLKNREQQKDFIRNYHQIDLQAHFTPHPKHRISFTGFDHYLQYDTPTETNYDDHDELRYGFSLGWRARWARRFETTYRLLGDSRQYAFLFRQRSQDNYTQRGLRFEFGFRWEPADRLRIEGFQYVYVTYNVKDFEDRNLTNRSIRSFENRFEAQWRPGRKWETTFTVYRRETQVSYLNWESFTETTLDTNQTLILDWMHRWPQGINLSSRVRLFPEIGYRHTAQIQQQQAAMLNLERILVPISLRSRQLQTGPVTTLALRERGPNRISLSVWWQLQQQDYRYQSRGRFATLALRYEEEELREIRRGVFPFISVDASWSLRSRQQKN